MIHDDAHERAKIDNLIAELRSQRCFSYDYFNEVYKICVERKRRKILEAIKEMDNNVNPLREPIFADEARMKQMVLHTYYVYMGDDDAYRQKVFAEFIKKRMEGMDKACEECWGMQACLEGLYEHAGYQGYHALTKFQEKLWVYQRHLWREFFGNSEEYMDVIPSEKPPVLYTDSNMYIPCFVFEPPYVVGYSEREFHARFMKEWNLTHYNPLLDEDLRGHFRDLAPYRNELADKPEKAYRDYRKAVIMFRKIKQTLS